MHSRLQVILQDQNLSDAIKETLDILRNPLEKSQSELSEAYTKLENMQEIKDIVREVYEKPGTDMGDFWVSFLEMSDPLAQNLHACHSQLYDEYKSSTYDMLPGYKSYDNLEYARCCLTTGQCLKICLKSKQNSLQHTSFSL